MTETFPENGIQTLIATKKGDRSMESLSRACGGTPTRANLQRPATKPSKTFPTNEVIVGLSRGLRVRVVDVVMAFAASLGLPIPEPSEDLVLPDAGHLPDASKDLLRSMAEQMLWWQEQVESQADSVAGEAPAEATPDNVHPFPMPNWAQAAADKGEVGIDHDQLPDD